MNIECDQEALDELESAFRFNDAVIRNLILSRNEAITETSPLSKGPESGDDTSKSESEDEEEEEEEEAEASALTD
jgi:small subunit ribosomal protein S6